MKYLLSAIMLLATVTSYSQTTTLKSVLLKQFKTTYNEKEWFVPASTAVEGLTPAQAAWKDGSGNHSVGQLANHIAFWNERELNKFLGKKIEDFKGSNDETFNAFDEKTWTTTVKKMNDVLAGWEKAIAAADENKIKEWSGTLANINAHNAYHTGQMIVMRKMQGAWDVEKGVK